MLTNEVLILLLIGHFLGDYYIQSDKLAKLKKETLGKLLIHCLEYFLCVTLIPAIFLRLDYLILSVEIAAFHLIIDFIKYLLEKNNVFNHKQDLVIYLVDQLLHVLTIVLVVKYNNVFYPVINVYLLVLLATLIIIKPCSVTIDKILMIYRPIDKPSKVNNAGVLIGYLERAIILILLVYQQFGAIGLVLAAKSIARYSEMSNNKIFAEYYLMGTLLSTFLVMIVYLLLFGQLF